jgi:hypothetical protein
VSDCNSFSVPAHTGGCAQSTRWSLCNAHAQLAKVAHAFPAMFAAWLLEVDRKEQRAKSMI